MGSRTWHDGPPPHEGWWNASTSKHEEVWRWWNGKYWSAPVRPRNPMAAVCAYAKMPTDNQPSMIRWTDYWPKDAAVPRIDPRGSRRGPAFINEYLRRIRGVSRRQWAPIFYALKSEMS